MSFVIATPETVAVAASDLARIGATIGAAGAAAADPTTAVMPAAADEVSAAISSLFASCAQGYQALSVQVEAFHNQFVQLMSAGAGNYAAAETANAKPLQTAAATVTPPTTTPPSTPSTSPPSGPLTVLRQDVQTVIGYIPPSVKGPIAELGSEARQVANAVISYIDPWATAISTGFQSAIS
jgi:hypothetical protein